MFSSRSINVSTTAMFMIMSIFIAGFARADVIYDTTAMVDDHTYTATRPCWLGGFAGPPSGTRYDNHVCDEVILEAPRMLTSVTADYLMSPPYRVPADGVLVEVFEDLSGVPSEVPTAVVLATGAAVTDSSFTHHLGGTFVGIRLVVDLSSNNLGLDAGTWWISIVPVDDTDKGRRYFQVRKTDSPPIGANPRYRNGGQDHGNGYTGTYGVDANDWQPFGTGSQPLTGNFSMKIEGTPAAQTGACCMTDGECSVATETDCGNAGGTYQGNATACERGVICPIPCPADLTDAKGGGPDGTVNVFDLFVLLSNWNTNGAGADLAEPTNVVDVFDLFVLLGAWGECN